MSKLYKYNPSLYEQSYYKTTLDTTYLTESHLEFFANHGQFVRNLVVRHMRIEVDNKEEKIIKVLRLMPLLEKITFDEVFIDQLAAGTSETNFAPVVDRKSVV